MAKRKTKRRSGGSALPRELWERWREAMGALARAWGPPAGRLARFLMRHRREVLGGALVALGIITAFALLKPDRYSLAGAWLKILRLGFGQGAYLAPLILAGAGGWLLGMDLLRERVRFPRKKLLGALLVYLAIQGMLHHLSLSPSRELAARGGGGGYLGWALSAPLRRSLGFGGGYLILSLGVLVGLSLIFPWSPRALVGTLWEGLRELGPLLKKVRLPSLPRLPMRSAPRQEPRLVLRPKPSRRKAPPSAEVASPKGAAATEVEGPGGPAEALEEARPPGGRWELPRLDEVLDEAPVEELSDAELEVRGRIIEEALANFGVPVQVVEINRGPTVTQFALKPGFVERRTASGKIRQVRVRVSRITALSSDLALALSASPVRMEAPVPGRPYVGLEVPNSRISLVKLKPVMESPEYEKLDSPLKVALGRDVSGGSVAADLVSMPHLLIAGATGSGKSVCINSFIVCLLCQNTPEDLKLILVDPKRVELVAYDGIPHLQVPVITEPENVLGVLHWATRQMDQRFQEFARAGVRNIETYNRARLIGRMPRMAIIVDELADVMAMAPYDVERTVCRLAQMARATGIHLVLATQRPSVDVVTGLIKANFPARISFAVTSQVDSRVILDTAGAEKLLGRGDMLYMASDSSKLVRLQGCFVSEEEIGRVVRFWRRSSVTRKFPVEMPLPLVDIQTEEAGDRGEEALLEEAISLVKGHRHASVSFLQRKLRIGYPRAARLMDLLEERGIVGPDEGGGRSREVLLGGEEEAEESVDKLADE